MIKPIGPTVPPIVFRNSQPLRNETEERAIYCVQIELEDGTKKEVQMTETEAKQYKEEQDKKKEELRKQEALKKQQEWQALINNPGAYVQSVTTNENKGFQ